MRSFLLVSLLPASLVLANPAPTAAPQWGPPHGGTTTVTKTTTATEFKTKTITVCPSVTAAIDFDVGDPGAPSSSWSYLGCYVDEPHPNRLINNTLTGLYVPGANSPLICAQRCASFGMNYAGVQFGSECYCDSAFKRLGEPRPAKECNYNCKGNLGETCGGYYRVQVYAKINRGKIVNGE